MKHLIFMVLLTVAPFNALAFYQDYGLDHKTRLRGYYSISASATQNPVDNVFYSRKDYTETTGTVRLLGDYKYGQSLALEANLLAGYKNVNYPLSYSGLVGNKETERSSALEWTLLDENKSQGRLGVDRLNLTYSNGRVDLKAGRQAINLATVYYFTPNDFFAPFSAGTFYRQYKPGVDAIRADYRTGRFSVFSLMAVAGYKTDSSGANGWSGEMDGKRNSYLARGTVLAGNTELGFIAGKVRRLKVYGWILQGELGDWAVRSEGHLGRPEEEGKRNYSEASIGVEKRFTSDLSVTFEHFLHGAGREKPSDYLLPSPSEGYLPYLGKEYSAAGINREFTPLFSGQALYEKSWTDGSSLLNFYAVYSISNESEAAITASIPFGEKPDRAALKSEFGSYPLAFALEYRGYF